jgi:hypothetical protein
VRFATAISIAVVVAATATAVAQARPASERGESGERARPPSAADDDERRGRGIPAASAEDVAKAPPAHRASGVIAPHRLSSRRYRLVNRLLAAPRHLVAASLWIPTVAAAGVDNYLESRGPDLYDRGAGDGGVRLGGMLGYESGHGFTAGARVGYGFGDAASLDLYGAFLGRHDQTVGVRAAAGRRLAGRVAPEISIELANDQNHRFAGVGDRDLGGGDGADPFGAEPVAEATFEDTALTASAAAPIRVGGGAWLVPSLRAARHHAEDDGEPSDLGRRFDTTSLFGFAEPVELGFAQLAAVYDTRRPAHEWISEAAPSTGWRLRAATGWGAGEAERSGAFSYGRYHASVERLFNLFRGNRVLTLSQRLEGVVADRRAIPFMLLPVLGGPESLSAFSRGRFRDKLATLSGARYEWAIGHRAQAALVAEAGAVHPDFEGLSLRAHHLSFGAELRMIGERETRARVRFAGSPDGALGLYLQIGGI